MTTLLWIIICYAGWLLMACLLQRRMVFPRHLVKPDPHAGDRIARLVKVWLETPEGNVESWFVPAPKATSSHPTPAVLYAHGNAELIDYQHDLIRGYSRLGVSVMLCEFRGYGRSAGSPSQKKITSDFAQCYDWLKARPEVDPTRIFFHGRSLGTGVVCSLARRRKPAALILVSPFTSIADMMAWYLIPRPFVRDPFDNAAVLKAYQGPVLLMHGKRDAVVPIRYSEALHGLSPRSTFRRYNCGHNDFPTHSSRFWSDIETHLRHAKILTDR